METNIDNDAVQNAHTARRFYKIKVPAPAGWNGTVGAIVNLG